MKKLALLSFLALDASVAHASFHLWQVSEIFTNEDGSIQYIELETDSDFQTALSGHQLRVTTSSGVSNFDIPTDLTSTMTARHSLLFATPGFENLSGAPTPDFVLPCGPFFDPAATSISAELVGALPALSFTGTIPIDGVDSIQRMGTSAVIMPNQPRNFGSNTASMITLDACQIDGSCSACDDGMFCTGAEACVGMECTATAPCAPGLCDEAGDRCTCSGPADCDDGNACTDDDCVASACVRTNNTATCDDGMFCTMTDACSGGACGGSGNPCGADQCNEVNDSCGACTTDAECSDNVFCNGPEVCTTGLCEVSTMPACDPATGTCDEDAQVCELFCGNGMNDASERCDDGNRAGGDGCSTSCTVESGFGCDTTVEPSVCMRTTPLDAGMPTDAGMITEEGGCGCRAASRGGEHTLALLALLGIALFVRRRRS